MHLICLLCFEIGSLTNSGCVSSLNSCVAKDEHELLIFLLLPLCKVLGRQLTQMNLKLTFSRVLWCSHRLRFLAVCDLFACSHVIPLGLQSRDPDYLLMDFPLISRMVTG